MLPERIYCVQCYDCEGKPTSVYYTFSLSDARRWLRKRVVPKYMCYGNPYGRAELDRDGLFLHYVLYTDRTFTEREEYSFEKVSFCIVRIPIPSKSSDAEKQCARFSVKQQLMRIQSRHS